MTPEPHHPLDYEWHPDMLDCRHCKGQHGGQGFRYHRQPNGDSMALCPNTGLPVVVKPYQPLPPGLKLREE